MAVRYSFHAGVFTNIATLAKGIAMANRIEATMSGVGTPNEVLGQWLANLQDDPNCKSLTGLSVALVPPLNCSKEFARACVAVVCASLNVSFVTTGQLFRVDEEGRVNSRYFSLGSERDLIVQLMS
jgi:hypothetical protein